MSKLIPGTVVELPVVREAPFGFFLSSEAGDILLHRSELTGDVTIGQKTEVFLYRDKQGRLAATMVIPSIRIGTYGWCHVTDMKEDLGVFIDIGISKDILLHKDDLPELKEVWPAAGGKLYCTLKTDKRNWLLAKPATEDVMKDLFKNADKNLLNKNISGIVYRTLHTGTFIITDEGYRGFIHASQREGEPRLGDTVRGRVIEVKEDGTMNVSLLPRGYEKIGGDAETIYNYLLSRNGSMPYSDKSSPEDIEKRFQMSKAAFKRALGRLMKQGKVYQKDGWTYKK